MPRDIQMVSRVIPTDPFDLVIFGGTGDLARRKILPGLYRRFTGGQMPPDARVIGAARSEMGVEDYRRSVGDAIAEFVPAKHRDPDSVAAFLGRLDYVRIDATGTDGWEDLARIMDRDVIRLPVRR